MAMGIVDEHEDPPELKKDIFWNQSEPKLIEHSEWAEVNIVSQSEMQEAKFENFGNLNHQNSDHL